MQGLKLSRALDIDLEGGLVEHVDCILEAGRTAIAQAEKLSYLGELIVHGPQGFSQISDWILKGEIVIPELSDQKSSKIATFQSRAKTDGETSSWRRI